MASCDNRAEPGVASSSWGTAVARCPAGFDDALSIDEREMLLEWWPDNLIAQASELETVLVRGALALCQGGFDPLQPGNDADTVIRLTQTDWSFQPPMIISIAETGSAREVRVAWFAGQGYTTSPDSLGVNQPRVIVFPSRPIPNEVWGSLVKALSQARLEDVPAWVDDGGSDGNHYIFEVAHGQTYKVVIRWDPTETPLAMLADHIMRWRLPYTLLPAPGAGRESVLHTPNRVR